MTPPAPVDGRVIVSRLHVAVYQGGRAITHPGYLTEVRSHPDKVLSSLLILPTDQPAYPLRLELIWQIASPWFDWRAFTARLERCDGCPLTARVPGLLYLGPTDVPSVTVLPSRMLDGRPEPPYVLTLRLDGFQSG